MSIYPVSHIDSDGPNLEKLGFQKKRCKYIVSSDKMLCCCLNKIENHDPSVIQEYKLRKNSESSNKWDKEECTEDAGPTDAYGKIKFTDTENFPSYVRVSNNTDVNKLITLLFDEEYWGLKKPELIISVTGGAEKISLNQKLKDAFSKGLVEAAVTTNALVTSGGTYGGCMKLVGEAFKENALSLDPNKKINLLGIADWCTIFNNSLLIGKNSAGQSREAVEYNLIKPRGEKKSLLDPNHTHFILVDDGFHYFGGEMKLRAKLEAKLRETAKTVVLVLGGGPNTAESIFNAISEKTPCVILESSGEMEAGFSYAINRIKTLTTEIEQSSLLKNEEFWNEVRRRLVNGFILKKDPETRAENTLKSIKKSLKLEYLHLLTVCRSRNGRAELDVAILEALLSAEKKTSNNFEAQLKLALRWNRIDIARNYLFNDENIDINLLKKFMTTALIQNKHEFVELFLEKGLSLRNFLTYRRLLFLYNKIPKNSLFQEMIDKKSDNVVESTKEVFNDKIKKKIDDKKNVITFKLIGEVLTELVDYSFEHKFMKFPYSDIEKDKVQEIVINGSNKYGEKMKNVIGLVRLEKKEVFNFDDECENPEHEMFLFNVLLCRQEMSMLFLTRGTNSIGSSLIATKIFKFYANEFDDNLKICEEMAKYFESLACDILKLFNENDELNSQLTLIRKLKEFENVTSMKIATSSRDLNFISMQSFQNFLDRIWYHKMLPDTNKAKLLICIAFPFLAPVLIKYRNKTDHTTEKSEILIKSQKKDEKKEDATLKPTDEENPGKTQNDEELIKKIDAEFTNDFFDRGIHANYNCFQFMYDFLNTPFVKFIYHQIWYLLFLLLFSYVVLCDFSKFKFETAKYSTTSLGLAISIPEIVLMIWIFAFITEEIIKFLKEEMKKYYIINKLIGDFWENINIGAILLYLVAFILRFINDDQCFKAARIIMAVDIILWFFKSLKAYTFLRQLGPKLYMIKKMLVQLAYFFLIVLLFMFAFGVSTTALMFQNQALDKNLLKNVFLPAYFMIGGEYYTRSVIMDASSGQCSDSSPYSECPEETGSSVALALYVIYLIFLNILLVNLLIAIFNNTYDTIEQEANEIWNSQRYTLVSEYYNKPLLPAPFVLLYYIFSVFKFILRKSTMSIFEPKRERGRFSKFLLRNRFFRYLTKKWTNEFVYELDEKEERKIIKIEASLTNEIINLREKDKKDNFEVKIEQSYEKLDILSSRFEEFMEKGNFVLNEKIQAIDTSLNKFLRSMK